MTTQRKTDIEYVSNGFTVEFMPVTTEGRQAWDDMLSQAGTTNFPVHMMPSIKLQLKEAGYTVRKARKVKETMTDAELLAALGL